MNTVFNAMVYLVWFLATFYTVFILLALLLHSDYLFENRRKRKGEWPLVSILVPAYNEEHSIANTIESLKKLRYQRVEFIILNDGSKDRTSAVVSRSIRNDSRFIFIDNKVNKGKAAVLNQGISIAKGEFVATMDADSIVEPRILQKTVPYFDDPSTGAVTVSVKVNKPKSWLDKMIAMEYAIGLSLFLKVFSFLDCVFVTPGPFSLFRTKMLKELGGFDAKNITEDLEIAYRIQKSRYKIRNCMEATVNTNLPEGFKRIYVQRRRWYSGAIRTLIQHKDVTFKPKYGLFGFFMPFNYLLIFLGLGLFFFSLYLSISKAVSNILYHRYTDYNFFDHLNFKIDVLTYGSVNLLAMSMTIFVVAIMILGIVALGRKFRENKIGLITYPFMFFAYQIFWTGSFINLLFKKELKWR
jgi:cellulose synthase/poly-beta-1,6-N-acetylglucosamine synthase-like glycosyltransferase